MGNFLMIGFIVYVFTTLLIMKSDVSKRTKIYGTTTLFTVYIFMSYYLLFGNPVENILINEFGEQAISLKFLLILLLISSFLMFLCLWLYKFISKIENK